MKKKVSIDFDDTFTRKDVREYVLELLDKDIDVWIVTSRHIAYWYDVVELATKIGIPQHRILFTGGEKKYKVIEELGYIWHLDDDKEELELLSNGIDVNDINWKDKCESFYIS